MGLTIAEKIMAAHCKGESIEHGKIIRPAIDFLFGNELGTGLAIHGREELLRAGVFDKSRIAIIPDHFTPSRNIEAAEQCKTVREFAREQGIEHYFEVGRMGIEHVILHEKGLVGAGDLIMGADSHTCTCGALGALAIGVGSTDFLYAMMLGETWLQVPETIKVVLSGKMPPYLTGKDLILYLLGQIGIDGATYKILEFCGETVSQLSLEDRFTMCNMATEGGAKSAIFAPDEVVKAYLKDRAARPCTFYASDPDASYCQVVEINVEKLDMQLSCPSSPANVKPLGEILAGERLPVDQVFIGSCTNGRLEDLRWAAKILRGKKVAPNTRLIIIPGSQDVYMQAMEEGLVKIFIEAGAAFCTPTCGPCIGGHMGILASGERGVATTNRNFPGRMGHVDSQLYLSGVPVAAATAVCGYIASPKEVMQSE